MKRGKGLKLGVIGAGSMGRNHARIAANLAGVNLIGVADASPSVAEEAGKIIGVPFYTDYRQLLPYAEIICIATPTQTHFEIARECLNAGKHILIEKPFTGNSTNARTLISLADTKGLVLTVGLIERFNPAFQKLIKMIKDEKLIGLDIKRLSPYPERITDADVIFDMMFHDLDLLLSIIPDEIVALRAKGEKIRSKLFDRVVAAITFSSGIIARLEASRVFGVKSRIISLTTEKYLIDANLLNKSIYIRDFSSPTPSALPIKAVDQLSEELKAFAFSVKSKNPPVVSGEDALRVLSLAEEIRNKC